MHLATRFVRGGSERRLIDIVKAIHEAHHIVVAGEFEPSRSRQLGSRVELVHVPELVRQVAPLNDWQAFRRLRKLINRILPNAVVLHQSKAHLLGRFSAGDTPTVVSLSMSPTPLRFGRAYWVAERFLARRTRAVVSVGLDLATEYQCRVGQRAGDVHIIRSSIDLTEMARWRGRRSDARAQLGIDKYDGVVLFVGSLDERKGVVGLPKLAQRLESLLDGNVRLLVAGAGPLNHVLAGSIKDTAAPIELLGHRRDIARLIAAADAVVLPSRAEGLPQVLVQAAAVGTPFVAFAATGVPELIDSGANGDVVPIGDWDGLATCLRSALVGPTASVRTPDLREWEPEYVHAQYRRLFRDIGAISRGE